MPSEHQRTDRNRVSSIPSRDVGSGSGSHRAAATTSALWAVGHDTPYSAATSVTGRLLPAIADASLSRSRSVTRARGLTASQVWVNDRRGHSDSTAPQSAFPPPQLDLLTRRPGRSLIRTSGRSFTVDRQHPAGRARPLPSGLLDDQLHRRRTGPFHAHDAELGLQPEQHRRRVGQHIGQHFEGDAGSIRHARGLAAGRCRRPTACRGHEPNTGYDTSAGSSGYPAKDRRAGKAGADQ